MCHCDKIRLIQGDESNSIIDILMVGDVLEDILSDWRVHECSSKTLSFIYNSYFVFVDVTLLFLGLI